MTGCRIQPVSLPPPSLSDNTADAERLVRALKPILGTDAVSIDLPLVKTLSSRLRNAQFSIRCVLFRERHRWDLLDVLPPGGKPPTAGLAVDLGTTRIALRLIDLSYRAMLGESTVSNPQLSIGPDILTRIHFSSRPGGLEALQSLAVEAINREIQRLCRHCGLEPGHIYAVSVAGNTAMTHLFLGVDPFGLIREPYIPVVNRPEVQKASELGIRVHPRARIFVFPNVGSYFGGDLIAGILHTGLHRRTGPALLVDVGTNAEVVLGESGWLVGCAGAAGPALESGVTRMGMIAGPGVIDGVEAGPGAGQFLVHTIDELPPIGICGSGLIDLAACLFRSGMVDRRGKFIPERGGPRFRTQDGATELVVVPAEASGTGKDLSIGQADIDSLLRSKAAMYAILETITATVGVPLDTLSRIYVAGAFGSFIRPESAITIGMLPDLPLTTYRAVGNSSLEGASLFLTSRGALDEIDRIRDQITYLELNVNPEFMNRFSAAKFIPHTDRKRFPSVTP